MNLSTEILISEKPPHRQDHLLPNNKNILMTAQQTIGLTAKKVAVVPTRSVPQGIAAMLALAPDGDLEATVKAMTDAIRVVRTGEITVATRSVEIDGVTVREGQAIGLLDGQLCCSGDELEAVTLNLLEKAVAEGSELLTLYYGSDMPPTRANRLVDQIRQAHASLMGVVEGGQPHYHLISVSEHGHRHIVTDSMPASRSGFLQIPPSSSPRCARATGSLWMRRLIPTSCRSPVSVLTCRPDLWPSLLRSSLGQTTLLQGGGSHHFHPRLGAPERYRPSRPHCQPAVPRAM
jgi:hypothetical protein